MDLKKWWKMNGWMDGLCSVLVAFHSTSANLYPLEGSCEVIENKQFVFAQSQVCACLIKGS